MEKSPMPDAVMQHSLASPSTISWVIHQKFELAVPLYRQEKEWEMLGLKLSRATMANWIMVSFRDWLSPVVDLLKKHTCTSMNYLLDGNCSISNNLAENCIRPFTIGRKNWLFSGSPKGATASAGIYTLVETAKANGLDPMKYITFILGDLPGTDYLNYPEYLDDYLPWGSIVQKRCK